MSLIESFPEISKVKGKFLSYVKYETTSDDNSSTVPSTETQLFFGAELVKELKEIGVENAEIDSKGYVIATLPANTEKDIPAVGFISHMDTSPDISGKGVNPLIIENYNGEDIVLNKAQNIILSPKEFPELKYYIGKTLITTDGTTLLGADDKAGIAEIMTAVSILTAHPEIPHGKICIGFTPDEEIGRGADHFDVEKFGAKFAYTLDGGRLGELEFESFNAALAKVTIKGKNVHPGTAKNKMINSILIAYELISMLPQNEAPMYTEGYEGFYHVQSINGDIESTKLQFLIRDHSTPIFQKRKTNVEAIVNFLNLKYGIGTVTLELKDQYFNMKEKIEPVIFIVDIANDAMKDAGITPIIKPIRGGTDGSRLSFMGLPTPNIFTGGENFHGKYEFVSVQSMEKAVEVILNIIETFAKK